MSIRHSLLAAAIVVFLVVAVAPAGAVTDPPSGERVYKQQVLIPLYDWNTGKPLIGSTPMRRKSGIGSPATTGTAAGCS